MHDSCTTVVRWQCPGDFRKKYPGQKLYVSDELHSCFFSLFMVATALNNKRSETIEKEISKIFAKYGKL